VVQTVVNGGSKLLIFVVRGASDRGLSGFQRDFGARSVDRPLAWRQTVNAPCPMELARVSRAGGSTMTSKVVVWSLIALGVVCGAASAIMLGVAYFIWTAPRKRLLELRLVTSGGHGTSGGWHSGCRCTRCRGAHADTQRAFGRARAQQRLPTGIRQQLLRLLHGCVEPMSQQS
jgi:Na+/glutamate symporter